MIVVLEGIRRQMEMRQITCPTCSHAFAVVADARTAICPRCGKALPILSSGISLDFELPIPKKKAPPTPPPVPPDAKLARISLRKASELRASHGFVDRSAVTKPTTSPGTRPPPDLPPSPEATVTEQHRSAVEIPPGRDHRRDLDAATGVDLPRRPGGAIVDPSFYPEGSVGIDELTIPHERSALIQVESGKWPSQDQDQVIEDDGWEVPPIEQVRTASESVPPPLPPLPPREKGALPWPAIPPARRPPGPPPPIPPPPIPSTELAVPESPVDDPAIAAPSLGAINEQEIPPPANLGEPDQPAPGLEPASELDDTASFHRLSISQRVAALSDAIEEVSLEIPLPPVMPDSDRFPPPQQPSTMTRLGLGSEVPPGPDTDAAAPFNLPDTGITVFVPELPIEERSLGEKSPESALPHYKSGGSQELAPLQQRRRGNAAGGHGVATKDDHGTASDHSLPLAKQSRVWIALLLAGSLILVAVGVGLLLFLR